MEIKKIRIFFFLLNVVVYSYAQKDNTFVQDSILEQKYNREGRGEGRKGDFEKAEIYFEKSIGLATKLYGSHNPKVIQSYMNLGIQQKNLGKYDKAIHNYSRAEELIKAIYGEKDSRLGMVYGNIGLVYKSKGDYSKALEYQESALRFFFTDTILYRKRIKMTEANMATTLVSLNRISEAIKISEKNIRVNNNLNPRYFDLLATIYADKGDFGLANTYYLKSILSWIKYYGPEMYWLGEEYNNYSYFLIKAERYDSAQKYNELAEKIILKTYGPKSVYYSDIQSNYGDIFLNRDSKAVTIKDFRIKKRNNLNKALEYYQKAAIAVIENYENEEPYSLPPIENAISEMQLLTVLKKKAQAFTLLAEIYQAEMDYENFLRFSISSLHTINACINLIHRLRIGYLDEDSKLMLAEKQESTFMDAIAIAYRLYRFTKEKQYLLMAFEFAEKSKSASFLASVKDMEAKEFGGIPDSLLVREQYLKINISNYKERLYQEKQRENPDSQKTNLYFSKIFQYNEEYNRLINLFERQYPKYYSFKYEDKVINIDEIQRNLKKKEVVIEYVINEPIDTVYPGQLYRFIISKDNVDLSLENIGYEYVQQIEFLHNFLSSSNYLYTRKSDFITYCSSANKLYNILLAPVSKLIEGKHITIIPDNKLSYIPFDALISAMPDTTKMDFRNLKYLVYDYPISYSYSSTLLFNYFEAEEHVSKKLLAFAPNYDYKEDSLGPEMNGEKLLPLPGAKAEVSLLKDYIPCDVYLDSMANEKSFKKLAPVYDILHLAMHTILNDSLPMFSKLIFSRPNGTSTEDGWLNTHEIYNMKLNARMAVLSACNTGSGKLQKGEGVMSLARGFLYAGCPSIIMTMWEVEDKSGTEIMRSFYDFISKGKEKDDALRLAKLKYIQNADPLKSHPHYWLGYVNIGNSDRLYQTKDICFILGITFALILVIIDQVLRQRRLRKK